MFKLAVFSLPVALLPLLVVHAVESLMAHAMLPDLAASMQQAVAHTSTDEPEVDPSSQAGPGSVALRIDLPLTLRF